MAERVEKINLDGVSLSNLLNEKFLDKINDLKDVIPVSLVLIKTKENFSIPLVISHQNKKEIEDKIVHIESPEQEFLEKIKEIVREL